MSASDVVAAQGSQQKNSEWENLLDAAHLELRAQQAGPALETHAADAANARGTSPNTPGGAGDDRRHGAAAADNPCGAGDDRHGAAAVAPSTGLGFATRTSTRARSTRGSGSGMVSSRDTTAHRADRDHAASLPADRPKAFLGHGSRAVPATRASTGTGGNILLETATANDYSTARPPCPPVVAGIPVASVRRMVSESTSVAVGTTSPPPVPPTACGMVAAAASNVLVEEKSRNVRAQVKVDSEGGPVRLAHPRRKGMGRRGPLGQSHFKGVSITRAGTWRAVIYKGRKQQYLGVFDSEFDAARAYDAAALRLFPEGAPLNNPDVVERQLNEISAADGKPIATAGTPNLTHGEESPQAWEA